MSLWFKISWILWNMQTSLGTLALKKGMSVTAWFILFFPKRPVTAKVHLKLFPGTLNKNCLRAWEGKSMKSWILTFSHYHCRYQLHWKASSDFILFYFKLFHFRIQQNSQDLLYLVIKRNFILGIFCWCIWPSLMTNKTKWKNFGFLPFHVTQLRGCSRSVPGSPALVGQ